MTTVVTVVITVEIYMGWITGSNGFCKIVFFNAFKVMINVDIGKLFKKYYEYFTDCYDCHKYNLSLL